MDEYGAALLAEGMGASRERILTAAAPDGGHATDGLIERSVTGRRG